MGHLIQLFTPPGARGLSRALGCSGPGIRKGEEMENQRTSFLQQKLGVVPALSLYSKGLKKTGKEGLAKTSGSPSWRKAQFSFTVKVSLKNSCHSQNPCTAEDVALQRWDKSSSCISRILQSLFLFSRGV